MDVKFSNIDFAGGTSYIELLVKDKSIVNVEITKDNHLAFCCILAPLCLPKASVSLTSNYVRHFYRHVPYKHM